MTEDTAQDQQSPQTNPALKALNIMVGARDLKGHDFTTKNI